MLQQLLLVLHILIAIAIISLVLLQHGRGADAGASFGSGSSNTMFGSTGAMPFLMKLTVVCAAIFFATSISLSVIAAHEAHHSKPLLAVPTHQHAVVKKPVSPDAGLSFAPSAPTEKDKK